MQEPSDAPYPAAARLHVITRTASSEPRSSSSPAWASPPSSAMTSGPGLRRRTAADDVVRPAVAAASANVRLYRGGHIRAAARKGTGGGDAGRVGRETLSVTGRPRSL